MQKRTAAKVADLLGLAEEWLSIGRPRKLPGQSRAEAWMYGLSTKVTSKNQLWIDKVSLVGAFKAARLEQGYSQRIQRYAEEELAQRCWPITYRRYGLQGIDDIEFDTRALIRDIRGARKRVEKMYLAE
jgi:predicted phage-related endonuclease